MKKTYIQPAIQTYPITPTTLLTDSETTNFNLTDPVEGDAANAASRSIDDDGWGD